MAADRMATAKTGPVHYWLSTLPDSTSCRTLVTNAMGRWMIEHDCQELKSELGLGHYEGRNWRGFHHHATLCIAAYGFLMHSTATVRHRSQAAAVPVLRSAAEQDLILNTVELGGHHVLVKT